MAKPWLLFSAMLLATALSGGDAGAADTSIALGELTVPPSSGVDSVHLKTAAQGELRGVDARLGAARRKRSVVVSIAIIDATPSPFACSVSALLSDAKTGNMIAILEGRARSEGDPTVEVRKRVVRAALRSAVSQIPEALAGF